MAYLVFISHAGPGGGATLGTDVWVANRIGEDAKQCGAQYFLDHLHVTLDGHDFEEQIVEKLKDARELWVLLTERSMQRRYVWLEIGAAWGLGIPIIPIVSEATKKTILHADNVPLLIQRRQMVVLDDIAAYQKFLDDFRKRVQGVR